MLKNVLPPFLWFTLTVGQKTDNYELVCNSCICSGPTSECHLLTTGTPVSKMATVEWRNGPQGLRNDDDCNSCIWWCTKVFHTSNVQFFTACSKTRVLHVITFKYSLQKFSETILP